MGKEDNRRGISKKVQRLAGQTVDMTVNVRRTLRSCKSRSTDYQPHPRAEVVIESPSTHPPEGQAYSHSVACARPPMRLRRVYP